MRQCSASHSGKGDYLIIIFFFSCVGGNESWNLWRGLFLAPPHSHFLVGEEAKQGIMQEFYFGVWCSMYHVQSTHAHAHRDVAGKKVGWSNKCEKEKGNFLLCTLLWLYHFYKAPAPTFTGDKNKIQYKESWPPKLFLCVFFFLFLSSRHRATVMGDSLLSPASNENVVKSGLSRLLSIICLHRTAQSQKSAKIWNQDS